MNDIILDHQIIVDKIGTVQTVRHDTADVRRRQEHIVRPFSGKKLVHSGLIREVAELIRREIGFEGELRFNSSKPDGTLRKLTDVSKLHALGWRHTIEIEEGVKRLYEWYLGIEK